MYRCTSIRQTIASDSCVYLYGSTWIRPRIPTWIHLDRGWTLWPVSQITAVTAQSRNTASKSSRTRPRVCRRSICLPHQGQMFWQREERASFADDADSNPRSVQTTTNCARRDWGIVCRYNGWLVRVSQDKKPFQHWANVADVGPVLKRRLVIGWVMVNEGER